jgi:hypothetical protein
MRAWKIMGAAAACLASTTASAEVMSDWIKPRLAVGPAVIVPSADRKAEVAGEATLSVTPFGPNLSAGYLRRNRAGYLYGEVSAWLFVSVGGGIGRWTNKADGMAGHLFVGVPFPIVGMDWTPSGRRVFAWGPALHGGLPAVLVYVEPAYRRFFGSVTGGQAEVFVKVTVDAWRLLGIRRD